MGHRILICGENGAGKSTLGADIAQRLGCPFLDIEDYFFPSKNDYSAQRESGTALQALALDMSRHDSWVLAARKAAYGPEMEGRFTAAVFLQVPKELGLGRVKQRSYQKFGERVLRGGDLYEREKEFFNMVEARSEQDILDWLDTLSVPVITLDGTRLVGENAQKLLGILLGAR